MSRRAAWFGWFLWALCVALGAFAVAVVLGPYIPPPPETDVLSLVTFLAVPLLMYATLGAIVVSRHPTNLVGWMLCAIGLVFALQSFATAYADYALLARAGSSLPGAVYMACFSQSWVALPVVLVPATLLVLLFP